MSCAPPPSIFRQRNFLSTVRIPSEKFLVPRQKSAFCQRNFLSGVWHPHFAKEISFPHSTRKISCSPSAFPQRNFLSAFGQRNFLSGFYRPDFARETSSRIPPEKFPPAFGGQFWRCGQKNAGRPCMRKTGLSSRNLDKVVAKVDSVRGKWIHLAQKWIKLADSK